MAKIYINTRVVNCCVCRGNGSLVKIINHYAYIGDIQLYMCNDCFDKLQENATISSKEICFKVIGKVLTFTKIIDSQGIQTL